MERVSVSVYQLFLQGGVTLFLTDILKLKRFPIKIEAPIYHLFL